MNDLQNHVDTIARRITEADFSDIYDDGEEDISAFDYLQDALDIEYIVGSDGQYRGARVLVAFGGPNIWIDTQRGIVEGAWWENHAKATFNDSHAKQNTIFRA